MAIQFPGPLAAEQSGTPAPQAVLELLRGLGKSNLQLEREASTSPWEALGSAFGEDPRATAQMFQRMTDPRERMDPWDYLQLISIGVSPFLAMIKGIPKGQLKHLRALIGTEKKARGPSFEKKIGMNLEGMRQRMLHEGASGEELDILRDLERDAVADKILRGTYYRGVGAKPSLTFDEQLQQMVLEYRGERIPGATLDPERLHTLHVGEPAGTSTTFHPKVGKRFSKRQFELPSDLQNRLDQALEKRAQFIQEAVNRNIAGTAYTNQIRPIDREIAQLETEAAEFLNFLWEKPFQRVLPKFGGPPLEKVLVTSFPEGQKALKETYQQAVEEILPQLMEGKVGTPGFLEAFPTDYPRFSNLMEAVSEPNAAMGKTGAIREFALRQKDLLQQRGYKGMLHGPSRYSEYELRMFDPKDILFLDERTLDDPDIQRYWKGSLSSYRPSLTATTSEQLDQFMSLASQEPGIGGKRLQAWKETQSMGSLRELYGPEDVQIPAARYLEKKLLAGENLIGQLDTQNFEGFRVTQFAELLADYEPIAKEMSPEGKKLLVGQLSDLLGRAAYKGQWQPKNQTYLLEDYSNSPLLQLVFSEAQKKRNLLMGLRTGK